MKIKVGINGFGRMGRLGFRAGWDHAEYEVIHVNEIATDATGSAHLLKFDSVHGTWSPDVDAEVGSESDAMIIGGQRVTYSSNASIAETDWSNCDIVIEATGKHHKKPETLQNLSLIHI